MTTNCNGGAALGTDAERMLFIDGQWRTAKNGLTHPIVDPSTEAEVAVVSHGDVTDAEEAVLAARRSFDEGDWSGKSVKERAAIIGEAVRILADRTEELVELEVAECGSPLKTATFLHVGFALAFMEHFVDAAPEFVTEKSLGFNTPPFSTSTVLREPLGVCTAITPFNFPFLLLVAKAIPALLMGNTVVAKPNPATPLTALALADALDRAGLPAGAFNVVTGDAPVGTLLASHRAVDKVSFTGSTPVGAAILASAAPTIKSVTVELGGKSPSIVCDDANLDLAVDGVLFGVFFYAGQCCESGTRVFVPRHLEADFVERLVARTKDIVLGPTTEWDTDLGPVINAGQVERLEGYVARATAAGARLATGGRRAEGFEKGHYFQPTILSGVSNDSEIAREELFGPVVSVIAYDDEREAVRLANDNEFGLAATIWSADLERAYDLAKRVRAGTVWINDHHMIRPDAPFGGYGLSGLGREFGEEGFLDYVETKHVYMALTNSVDRRFWSMLLPT